MLAVLLVQLRFSTTIAAARYGSSRRPSFDKLIFVQSNGTAK